MAGNAIGGSLVFFLPGAFWVLAGRYAEPLHLEGFFYGIKYQVHCALVIFEIQ